MNRNHYETCGRCHRHPCGCRPTPTKLSAIRKLHNEAPNGDTGRTLLAEVEALSVERDNLASALAQVRGLASALLDRLNESDAKIGPAAISAADALDATADATPSDLAMARDAKTWEQAIEVVKAKGEAARRVLDRDNLSELTRANLLTCAEVCDEIVVLLKRSTRDAPRSECGRGPVPDEHPLVKEWLVAFPRPRTHLENRSVTITWSMNGDPPGVVAHIWTPQVGSQHFCAETVEEALGAAFEWVSKLERSHER